MKVNIKLTASLKFVAKTLALMEDIALRPPRKTKRLKLLMGTQADNVMNVHKTLMSCPVPPIRSDTSIF